MRLYTGTSGFSYTSWRGAFYPRELKRPDLLRFYATKLDSVEINYTFRRMPKAETLASWREQVAEGFRFVLKAPQRITHRQRLKDVAEPVGALWRAAQALGPCLGPVLFQLPPYARKDLDVLRAFLDSLPEGMRAVMEFRHPSWSSEDVFELLRARGAALCTADHDAEEGAPAPALVRTAGFAYLRLRRAHYATQALKDWLAALRAAAPAEAFVFFKHEEEGAAPRFALELRRLHAAEDSGSEQRGAPL